MVYILRSLNVILTVGEWPHLNIAALQLILYLRRFSIEISVNNKTSFQHEFSTHRTTRLSYSDQILFVNCKVSRTLLTVI